MRYSILIDCITTLSPFNLYVTFTRNSPLDVGSLPTRKPLSFLSALCTTEKPVGLFVSKKVFNIATAPLPSHFFEEPGTAISTWLSIEDVSEDTFPDLKALDTGVISAARTDKNENTNARIMINRFIISLIF
jgi:hypothetical protein